jgi:hypothetical protein
MTGWGWVALGSRDSLSSPACDSGPIAFSSPCLTQTIWSSDTALCATGKIPALSTGASYDYDNNWGIMVGVNATGDEPTGPIGRTFPWLALGLTGTPIKGLRVIAHLRDDPARTMYCFEGATSLAKLDITKFSTTCSGGSGTGKTLTVTDSAKIDKLGVWVPSASTEITVSDLCITSIGLGSLPSTLTATVTTTNALNTAQSLWSSIR